jgi:hypothetical protein
MTDSEKQELENYRKCLHQIIELMRFEIDYSESDVGYSLASKIIEVIKSEEFGNIYEKHQPWNYNK